MHLVFTAVLSFNNVITDILFCTKKGQSLRPTPGFLKALLGIIWLNVTLQSEKLSAL